MEVWQELHGTGIRFQGQLVGRLGKIEGAVGRGEMAENGPLAL